ncbi:MAG: radical SAM protein [Treponema sp.]|nr:radical SAM protein [Treponema sp.]
MNDTLSSYKNCRLCPRKCGVDRSAGKKGFCGETSALRVAAASIHRGEEPPITGTGGSGVVFVSGCALQCAFCQNYQISQQGMGRTVTEAEFVRICLALQEKNAENINIVTGSHAAPALAAGIKAARKQGLVIPVLWNSSGYETLETLSPLEDVIDGYLPDLKTLDSALAERFFKAADYGEAASMAIKKMLEFRDMRYEGAILRSGVIVRHLVLPGRLDATRDVLRWFAENAMGKGLLSLMTQYTPVRSGDMPDRSVNEAEYEVVLNWLDEFGIDDGFYQELTLSADSEWLPDFKRVNSFSSELSTPVWHWRAGFV